MRTRHIFIFEAVEDIDEETGEFQIDSEEVLARSESEAWAILATLGPLYGDEQLPMCSADFDAFRLAVVL